MSCKVHVLQYGKKVPPNGIAIDTTSRSDNWSKRLSPFYLGPVSLYGTYTARNVENGWQYTKVYEEDVDECGEPSYKYWEWALQGWDKSRAERYPKGKGRKPLYSFWNGEKLTYIEARRRVYCPLYANAVLKSNAYKKLEEIVKNSDCDIYLRDFDAYDHNALGMTLEEVLACDSKKMGHAFVLLMLLTNQQVWKN